MLSNLYEKNCILLLWFIFIVIVVAKSSSYYCEFLLFSGFFTGKYISNFDVEILLRKEFSYFLKYEASLLGNGDRGKMLKEG